MRTSEIISGGSRPLLPVSTGTYRQREYTALLAELRASTNAAPAPRVTAPDTSQHEFPGDLAYAEYLARRGA